MPRLKRAKKTETVRPLDGGPLVGIVMGSQSDWETMKRAADVFETFGVPFETAIVSAHRTPKRLVSFAAEAAGRGLKVIIAGAGGAAHLPGMMAAMTPLPVLGVPVESKALKGLDSLLSIAQMPAGIPVGTLAIGAAGAVNAGLLAVAILALESPDLTRALEDWRATQTASVAARPVSVLARVASSKTKARAKPKTRKGG